MATASFHRNLIIPASKVEWRESQRIGEGGCGEVFKIKHVDWGDLAFKRLAVKVEPVKSRIVANLKGEASALAEMRHPNIVQFVGILWEGDTFGFAMSLAEHGSLDAFIDQHEVHWSTKLEFLRQACSAMVYLHSLHTPVFHGDLKLCNLLLDDGLIVKVADFGLSNWRQCQTSVTKKSISGTITHIPPESLNDINLSLSAERDVYSFGILTWELFAEKAPFSGANEAQIERAVIRGQRPDMGQLPADTPQAALKLMQGAWDQSAFHRPSFIELQTALVSLCQQNKELLNEQKHALMGNVLGVKPKVHVFRERIELQYPLFDEEEDKMERSRQSHEAFMKSREKSTLGRADILKKINDYVCGPEKGVPLLILGQPGTGKSFIMTKAADNTVSLAMAKKIPNGGKTGWYIFHHFVGAVPGSTELMTMLCRLLKELKLADDSSMPTDLDHAVGATISALTNPSTQPVVLFVDALNQLNEDGAAIFSNWVPRKLSSKVRCVFSMINGSPAHQNLMDRSGKPAEQIVSPLSLAIRKDMVSEYLGKYNKRLDMDQMFNLLSKKASENPLWLSIACEELRVFGNFRQVSEKLNSLPDGLLDLLMSVLTRFEHEGGGHLLVATLCLIEVSSFGLLESELLSILADEDNLLPPEGKQEKGKDKKKTASLDKLPAMKWAAVYRSLRTFLRPFGDSGEGRLDFYHRTLSKVVRKKYLQDKDSQNSDTVSISSEMPPTEGEADNSEKKLSPAYHWWHAKLADFFEASENLDRKLEEYPYHLIKLKDADRMKVFLCDWKVIDRLYDNDHSLKLLRFWGHCGGLEVMATAYAESLSELKENGIEETVLCWRYEQMARIMTQAALFKQGAALGEEAVALEEKLGSRKEKMADLYSMLAYTMSQEGRSQDYLYRSHVPGLRKCFEFQEKAIAIYEELQDDKSYKLKLGTVLMDYAFVLNSFAQCAADAQLSADDARELAKTRTEQAMKIMRELKDLGKVAEAIMTKAILTPAHSEQVKLYEEAEALCLQTHGLYHPLMMRIHLNYGICHEEMGDYYKAYEYFRKDYEIVLEVFGKDHKNINRPIKILVEPMYRRIAGEKGQTIPGYY